MKTPDLENFSSALDRLLAGQPVDTAAMPPEVARDLEFARRVACLDLSVAARGKVRLRQRLEQRTASLEQASEKILEQRWAPWLGLAVIALLFLNGAFQSLSWVSAPASPSLATVLAAQMSPNTPYASQTVFPESAQPQANLQLHALEIPLPVPTPIAAQMIARPVLYSPADIPNGTGPIATP